MDKKSLDIIVEEFFDTGKLVLNENYWDDTVRIFTNLRNNHQTVDELLNKYYKITTEYYRNRTDEFNNIMVNGEMPVLEFIEGLKSDEVDEEVYEDDGVIFDEPTTDTTEVEDEVILPTTDTTDLGTEEPLNISKEVRNLNPDYFREKKVDKQNNTPLLSLSRNYSDDKDSELYKSNLRLLQYILWKGIWGDGNKSIIMNQQLTPEVENKLTQEIDNSEFGEITEYLLDIFQGHHKLKDYKKENNIIMLTSPHFVEYKKEVEKLNKTVDKWTWDKLMEVMEGKEIKKLESIPDSEGNIDRIINKSQIITIDPNNDTFDESKRDMFKSLSLKFFNNLHNNEIYKTTFQKQWGDLQQKFLKGIQRVRKIEELEKEREDFINQFPKISTGVLRTKFDREIENLKSISNNIDGEPIEFWENYKDRWDEINRRTGGGSTEGEKEKEDLQKEYVKYRNRRSTIEGIYEKIIDKLKEALRGGILSINEINTILHNVNDSLYKVFDTDKQLSTQINNARNLIKDLFDKLSKKDDIDVYDVIDFLENINTKTFQHLKYELSFCECRNDDDEMLIPYFKDCGSSIGNKSRLLPNNTLLKELIDSDSDWEDCVVTLYDAIIRGDGRSIQKHDITSNIDVLLENDVIINSGSTIEVKRIDDSPKVRESGHILSEFLSLYKNEPDRTNYLIPEKYNKYNKIIEGLVNRLNHDDGGIIIEFDSTGGIFLKDYMFYPRGTYRLEWSTDSERAQIKAGEGREEDEKRLSVKFIITGEGHKWVTGNCNIGVPNTIEESITNFFDTGNFEF